MAMVYEPLHHKYRPQSFAQLVGQHAIATTLCSALQQQRIPPAYLFCGPRGTGKTSSARILAKSLNCIQTDNPTPTPCGQCETCRSITKGSALDVIEIDAASNTGVDNIRELIERSQFAPVQCRYKVYVIDECLTGDTLVQTREGLVRIDDPQIEGQQVLSYNEQSGGWEYKKALRWLDQGTRDILEIQTTHRRIRCTGNHLIRTNVGWVAARDVKEGMTILSPAPAVAAPSSTNTALMGEFAALSEAINSKATPTGKSPTASTISLLKQSCFAPYVNADAARSSRSPQWHTSLETVVSVRPAGREAVYDIEVEDNHNFVANGLLVHNCHMLSTAAFNALLKTLEEPPERVVFVLATTDPQRVLPTIISRCQRFDFRRIPLEEMVVHLQTIANQEGIKIEPDALRLVAQVSQGGLRDAQSLLDQLSLLTEGVTVEQVWDLVGAVPERNLLALVQAIAADDGVQVLEQARHLMDRGREPLVVLQNLASFYRDLLVAKTACDRNDLVAITPSTWDELVNFAQSLDLGIILAGQQRLREAEVQVKNTTQPRLWLEVTLLGLLPSTLAAQTVAVSPDTGSALPSRRASQTVTPPAAPVPVPPAQSISPQATVAASSTPASGPAHTRPASSQPAAAAAADTVLVSNTSASPTVKEKEATAQPVQSAPDEPVNTTPAQPAKPASTPTPAPAPAPPPAPQVNIRDIWQQVIGRLHPLSKALLKEHGELLEYTGNQATVAISSRNLLKIAQSKVPDIEKAFAQVVNQPIRISLTVAADSSDSASSSSPSTGASTDFNANQQSGMVPTAQPVDAAPAANPQNFNLVTHSAHEPLNEANGSQPENGAQNSAAQSEPRAVADADAPQSNGTPSGAGAAFEPVGPLPSVYTEDVVARASRSFAQFFNGQVVELNEADAIFWSATADLAQSTAATSQPTPSGRATTADDQNGRSGQVAQSEATPNEAMHAEQMHDSLPNGSVERTSTSTITSVPPASTGFSSTYDESDDDDDDDLPF